MFNWIPYLASIPFGATWGIGFAVIGCLGLLAGGVTLSIYRGDYYLPGKVLGVVGGSSSSGRSGRCFSSRCPSWQ